MDKFETEIYLRYKQIIESQKACSFTCHPGLVPGFPFLCKTELSSCRALPDRIQNDSCAVPRPVYMADLLERYDAFCFDGYGTLYNRGSFVYPGAMEWFKMLRRAGKHLRLVTNAASDVDEVLARDADKRGFDFSTEETISSGSLLKDLCAELRSRGLKLREVYYIGRETGKHVLEKPVELPLLKWMLNLPSR